LSRPFVSVLIDTYNHEKFIEQAITSVLEQGFPASDREILVVDDGSTDRTPAIVKGFEPQVRLLRKQNGGQASAFNAGIPECHGEIIAFLDGDDWWAPGKLRAIAQAFQQNPTARMVGHAYFQSSGNGSQVITMGHSEFLRRDDPVYAETFRLRRAFLGTSRLALQSSLARQIIPVPEAIVFEADEYLFSIAAALSDFVILPEPLTHYRIHGSNLFVAAGGNRDGLRRKQKVLRELAESLRNSFAFFDVPPSFTRPVVEMVSLEEAQLRLMLDGGSSLETYRTETGIYRIQHSDAPRRSRFFRWLSMLPALLLPPRWFYGARRWLASRTWYGRAREKMVPVPNLTKIPVNYRQTSTSSGTDDRQPGRISNASSTRLKARLKSFWNSQELYWSLMTEESALDSENRARAASVIPDGSRVLDVACGRAANCVWLVGRVQYFGCDISQKGLSCVQRDNLRLVCADAEDLPFADSSVDAVLSTYALEHSADPVRMLSEMVRVVRPGGKIVLLGPAWDFPFWFPNSLRAKAQNRLWLLKYSLKRLFGQLWALAGGSSPFMIVEEPEAFTLPFIYDADAVYVVWTYEVIRQMKKWGCKSVHTSVDNKMLGSNPFVGALKRALMLFPLYKNAGSTAFMVFER
jgi:glycosyltransferase involved in cell wall biosynthesis/ubiquinone/menaquinone biosynthesis C-methylase UbiE